MNYFRVCRITIDNVRQVLQSVFHAKQYPWQDSQADGNWFLKNERWDSKLTHEMELKIKQGNSFRWDATILFHVLLYSSHCLLLKRVPGTQGSLQTDSKMVKATMSADFTRYVKQGYVIFFDLGSTFFRSRVASGKTIQPNSFFISKAFSHPSTNADIYVCTREWLVVEELSHVRNDKFAHIDACSVTDEELSILVQNLTKMYSQLNVPKKLIIEMQSMATGKCKWLYYNLHKHC